MPQFDRTGPEGKGSQTGRKMGKCNPNNDVTDESRIEQRGRGRGFRMRNNSATGRGNGFGFGSGRGLGRR